MDNDIGTRLTALEKEVAQAMTTTALPATGLLREKEIVPSLIPVARSTWWKWVREGKVPQPIRIGGMTAWKTEDIRALIEKGGM